MCLQCYNEAGDGYNEENGEYTITATMKLVMDTMRRMVRTQILEVNSLP